MLAQIVDRGSIDDWRALYALMSGGQSDAQRLRHRLLEVIYGVPIGFPHSWLAALASLGESVDWTLAVPEQEGEARI